MVKNSKVKVIGLCTCSSIPSNPNYLAAEIGCVEPEDILTPAPAAGINHCAAILSLKLKDGRDALQLAKEKSSNPIVKFFLENYGVLPYCWSHWTEFFPFLCDLEEEYKGRLQGLRMKFGLRVHDMSEEQKRVAKWEKLVEDMATGVKDLSLDVLPSGEAILVVDIIEALVENKNEVYVVNTLNRGAIENLPFDAIVEVSSVVGGYGVIPMHVGALPPPLAAVLNNHIEVQRLTVEAALTGDRSLAFRALLQDPQVAAKLKPDKVSRLLDDLLNAHAQYLPRFFKK
jgi:alpha-galactosidase